MDSMSAFIMGEANRGKEMRVFDWNKAAELIRDRKPSVVVAGLASDMEWTAGRIFENGKIVDDDYAYLASTWAIPVIVLDGDEVDCFVMESTIPKEWTGDPAKLCWPESARNILVEANNG